MIVEHKYRFSRSSPVRKPIKQDNSGRELPLSKYLFTAILLGLGVFQFFFKFDDFYVRVGARRGGGGGTPLRA